MVGATLAVALVGGAVARTLRSPWLLPWLPWLPLRPSGPLRSP
ncbi:MAG: hypothetical protein ACJ8BW_35125 [Ktedonobacteraceae bacterium]